jgi:glycosyltransferase involved in cell wall biosynthesis
VAVNPKDANPCQEHLYAAMHDEGVAVRYLGELTLSHTVNLLLLPAEVVASPLRGYGVVHLHWDFGFRFPGVGRSRAVGRLSYRWYRLFLRTVAAGGGWLVWTAHYVLPHTPVLPDDVASRRELARRADLVIAYSEAILESLAALGIESRAAAVVPHGPFGEVRPPARPRTSRPPDQPLTLLFTGVEGLTGGALRHVVRMPRQRLAELGEAGYAFSRLHSGAEIARTTVALLGWLGEAEPAPERSGRA